MTIHSPKVGLFLLKIYAVRLLYNTVIQLLLVGFRMLRNTSPRFKLLWEGHQGRQKKWDVIPIQTTDCTLWFHTASLGEFEQCRPLIECCRAERPDVKILLTFFSPSGFEIQKNYPHADGIIYLPFDTLKNVNCFLRRFQPNVAVFVKYEFWPNYLHALYQRKIPIFSISSRFHKNQIFFKPFGKWMLNHLKYVSYFFVQDEESKLLLEKQGIKYVAISGDTRMDRVLEIFEQCQPIPEVTAFMGEKKGVVIGSSWEEDHEILFPKLIEHTNIKIIIAPHEVHDKAIASLLKHISVPVARWSTFDLDRDCNKQVLVVDTIGLLSRLYQYALWSYVGGAMRPRGLHNILEPAVFGIPVVVGPNISKFSEALDLAQLGGVFSVASKVHFASVANQLNSDTIMREKAGKVNASYVIEKSGATERIFNAIITVIS